MCVCLFKPRNCPLCVIYIYFPRWHGCRTTSSCFFEKYILYWPPYKPLFSSVWPLNKQLPYLLTFFMVFIWVTSIEPLYAYNSWTLSVVKKSKNSIPRFNFLPSSALGVQGFPTEYVEDSIVLCWFNIHSSQSQFLTSSVIVEDYFASTHSVGHQCFITMHAY